MTKLRSASRFGARYSTPLKEIYRDVEDIQKNLQECPKCNRTALRRRGFARWECRKCGAIIAGGAFTPHTKLGNIVERIVRKGEKLEEVLPQALEEPAEAAEPAEENKENEGA